MSVEYVISKTGEEIVRILRQTLKQEMNMEAEHIGIGKPDENNGLQVCVYLYDIQRNAGITPSDMIPVSATQYRYPSVYYDLYYVIVPCLDSDLKYRMQEEIKLLDVFMQCLGDLRMLHLDQEIPFELFDMEFENKTKFWSGLGQNMRMAVYCKAGPVEIRSGRTKDVTRVREINMKVFPEGGED